MIFKTDQPATLGTSSNTTLDIETVGIASNPDKNLPVAIIGGGFAGLLAAQLLRRHGVPFVLYERGDELGGLARSFRDENGFAHDLGAHFITNRLASALGVSEQCSDVKQYGESVLLDDRTYSYPFGLMRNPKLLLGAAASMARRCLKSQSTESAADWFEQAYGKPMAQRVAIPLLEQWAGVDASELAASVANKIPQSVIETMWLTMGRTMTGRPIAVGYCREKPQSTRVWCVYPDEGIGALISKLTSDLDDSIQLESHVESITADSGQIVSVRVNGHEQPVSAVISTVPIHILADLVKGTDALAPLSKFRYRAMACVNLQFSGEGLLPNAVLWTPEEQFPFLRLTELTQGVPWMAPPGKTQISADIGCEIGGDIWSMPDDRLGELCIESIDPIISNARNKYLGCKVARAPFAYPLFLREYEADRVALEQSTGVDGLHVIGRNGEFAHILMEDIYWRTLTKVRQVVAARNNTERYI